jgi:hypothetical protein
MLKPSWRIFRRMQNTAIAVAALIYFAAALQAWGLAEPTAAVKLVRIGLSPALCLIATCLAAVGVPALRAMVLRHLWLSYRTGFGQSVTSVLAGVGVLIALAGLIFWQTAQAARGGAFPGGAFAGYAAGIGWLLAQRLLLARIEADPTLRAQIEDL